MLNEKTFSIEHILRLQGDSGRDPGLSEGYDPGSCLYYR